MKFHPLSLEGAYLIEPDPISDERGFFARVFCKTEFEQKDLNPNLDQCSISFNHRKGTVRGMHFQKDPHAEVKIVRCTRGAIYDVVLDLRPDSPTYKKWEGVALSAENRKMLYIPEGLAHGFQTLEDNTEIFYQISRPFAPASASGVRWNDPSFNIVWPLEISIIANKDQTFPTYEESPCYRC